MERGVFIVFEGIDGSGKSSCIDAVASEIGGARETVRTAEPTKGDIGMLLRSSADMMPETEALLFVADRAQHTREIREWVNSGKVVLCDRYYASTLAYQSAEMNGRSVDLGWLKTLNDNVILEPDATLLFDIDPKTGLERVESRGAKSKFERLEYLTDVRNTYLELAKERNFIVIDASRSREDVLADVMRHISKFI
ncbi:MAG: dTMP kinase [Methanomassiliicoccaceae archaeon]|jgi:dTMP kinase|nr:dTMP kinase [Methanomassiliicoccaceae archaeon]